MEHMDDTLEINIRNFKYVNHHVGSDVYPYEIIEVVNDKTIKVREMKAEPDKENGYDYYLGGPWICTPDEREPIITITRRKNGNWYPQGQKDWYNPFSFGSRPYKYRDPHF